MSTLGWFAILTGLIIIQRISKGRATNIPEDLSDAFQAIITGKSDDLSEVGNRVGETLTPSAGTVLGLGVANALGTDAAGRLADAQRSTNQNIVYWGKKLGEAARGYRFGSAGPDYYDCSGLVYRAVQKVGYTGPRFFTATVQGMPGFARIASPELGVSQVTAGDIVLWPGHHMGIVTGTNRMYSARNPRSGIGESAIKGFRKESPIYLRFGK